MCQGNLNNFWLLLHRFQKVAFSVKTIHLHDNDIIITISFSNLSTLETFFLKSYRFRWKRSSFLIIFGCGFDKNNMKAYSCGRDLRKSEYKSPENETRFLFSSLNREGLELL